MTIAFRLNNVSFAYDTEPVLRIPKLEIDSGEMVVLVGPNGSGKTTLLHLLAFLESPRSGEVRFFGDEVGPSNLLEVRRKVALLLQNPYLFRESVLGNVTWALRCRGIAKDTAREIAEQALAMVGLSGFGPRHARSLSGGESQRVALARGIALEPSVLLLDEPFNHMDADAVRLTGELVDQLRRERGTTVVMTTHAREKMHATQHRVIHLRRGRVIPNRPDNLFKGMLNEPGIVFDTGRITIHLDTPAQDGDVAAIDPCGITIRLGCAALATRNSYCGTVIGLTDEGALVRVVVCAGERFQALISANDPVLKDLRLGLQVTVELAAGSVWIL